MTTTNNWFSDACESIKCGPNAECIAARHSGQCKCIAGYIGNAASDKGCHLREIACTKKADCPDEFYCHKGVCKGDDPIYIEISHLQT